MGVIACAHDDDRASTTGERLVFSSFHEVPQYVADEAGRGTRQGRR